MRIPFWMGVIPLLGCSIPSNKLGSPNPGGGPPHPGGAGLSCAKAGDTRACCVTGMQTCTGAGEFPYWGPCLDGGGAMLSCCPPEEFQYCTVDMGPPPGVCVPGEFTYCDGGAPPPPPLCMQGGVNNEPGILVGFYPDVGQTVGRGEFIKVWVNDEGASIVAPGEQVDLASGMITVPGDRTATAADGYLWEPAVYIAPQSAETGGTPHFPQLIKGSYNPTTTRGPGILVPGMEPVPPGPLDCSSSGCRQYFTEFFWSVDALGLGPGTYTAEFVIHDGDRDRGVGCISIQIR